MSIPVSRPVDMPKPNRTLRTYIKEVLHDPRTGVNCQRGSETLQRYWLREAKVTSRVVWIVLIGVLLSGACGGRESDEARIRDATIRYMRLTPTADMSKWGRDELKWQSRPPFMSRSFITMRYLNRAPLGDLDRPNWQDGIPRFSEPAIQAVTIEGQRATVTVDATPSPDWVGKAVRERYLMKLRLEDRQWRVDQQEGAEDHTCLNDGAEGLGDGSAVPGWNVRLKPDGRFTTQTTVADADWATVTVISVASNPNAVHAGGGAIRVAGRTETSRELDEVCRGLVAVDYWHLPGPGNSTSSGITLFGMNGERLFHISSGLYATLFGVSQSGTATRYTHVVITVDTNDSGGHATVNIDGRFTSMQVQYPGDNITRLARGIRYVGVSSLGGESFIDDIVIRHR